MGVAEAVRERSEPLYQTGDVVFVTAEGAHGKLVDHWEDPSHRHWYTARIDGCKLIDVMQDEIARVG